MSLVDLQGAFDLHIHSHPSLFTRTGDDLDMANHAAQSGLAGILIKSHFESTVGRAYLADKVVEGVRVFGGLALNHFAGGINPAAVENALKLGAKQIWMPTVDARAHEVVYGHTGGFGYQESGSRVVRPSITIFNDDGQLTDDAKAVVELVRDHNAILGTAHLCWDEILALTKFAHEIKFGKLLVTHPYFDPPLLTVPQQKELTDLGATLELCGGNLYPIPGTARLEYYNQTVTEIGAASIILTSDAGQPRKSLPAEVLRVFAQCLLETGISQSEINVMTKENPARLLGL